MKHVNKRKSVQRGAWNLVVGNSTPKLSIIADFVSGSSTSSQ